MHIKVIPIVFSNVVIIFKNKIKQSFLKASSVLNVDNSESIFPVRGISHKDSAGPDVAGAVDETKGEAGSVLNALVKTESAIMTKKEIS